jgi:hypothetical protein
MATSDLLRSESPNFRSIIEKVVSTFDRLWYLAMNSARWNMK